MAKSIPTTSFYGSRRTTIRITNHGVEEKEANLGIIVPDAFNSDIEDEESDENENNDVIIRGDMNISNDDDGEDSDDCDDYHYDDNEHGENNVFTFPENPVPDNVVKTTPEGTSVTRKSATKSKATMKIPMPRWRKREAAVVNSVFCGEPLPSPPNEVLTPIEYFKNFFDDQLIGHISEQTNLYSVQKNGSSVATTADEIEQYIGILLLMGIYKIPQYRMYWSRELNISSISETMPVNRFDKIKSFFHCNDNSKNVQRSHPEFDKLFKVRPVIDSVQNKCRKVPQEEKHSIDEQIIPTKGRSPIRQYIPNKPHKWGIKVWARCGVSGIVYDFDVYTGASPKGNLDESLQNFGVGGNVVARLSSTLQRNVGYKLYFDNYFSSVALMQYLQKERIWAVATIRADRLKGAEKVLEDKKSLSKKGRGSSDWCVDANSNVVIVRWMDNGVVQLISNYIGKDDGSKAQRWSAREKKFITISRPLMVEEYNLHMGGVDLCDMLMALYRIRLRSNKYYMHIIYYCIGVSVINGWLLYRRHCMQLGIPSKDELTLIQFQSMVANALTLAGKSTQPRRGRPSITPPPKKKTKCHAVATPINDVCFDNVGHIPDFEEKQQRCRYCPKGYSAVKCVKCKVHLCFVRGRNCFKNFHSK
ncbi:piggyBac transposable element-derived protein 3-like [Rhopilema esculentum]|uniref:piggyBac transposable element-derived protein 3-like n=1 Tax=Rhopilema esculentum TaxID=499914 RepID=UPI0031DE5055